MHDKIYNVEDSDTLDSDSCGGEYIDLAEEINDHIGDLSFQHVPPSLIKEMRILLNPDAPDGADWRILGEKLLGWDKRKIDYVNSIQKSYGCNASVLLHDYNRSMREMIQALEEMGRTDVLLVIKEFIPEIKAKRPVENSEAGSSTSSMSRAGFVCQSAQDGDFIGEPLHPLMCASSPSTRHINGHVQENNVTMDTLDVDKPPRQHIQDSVNMLQGHDPTLLGSIDSMQVNIHSMPVQDIEMETFVSHPTEVPAPFDTTVIRGQYGMTSMDDMNYIPQDPVQHMDTRQAETSPRMSDYNDPVHNVGQSPSSPRYGALQKNPRREIHRENFLRKIPEERAISPTKRDDISSKTRLGMSGGTMIEMPPTQQPQALINSYGLKKYGVTMNSVLPSFEEAFYGSNTQKVASGINHEEYDTSKKGNTIPRSSTEKLRQSLPRGVPVSLSQLHRDKRTISVPDKYKHQNFSKDGRNIKVFISFTKDTYEHTRQVHKLAISLKVNEFTAILDRDRTKEHLDLARDMQFWLDKNFSEDDFILVCISPNYKTVTECDPQQLKQWTQQCLNTRYIHKLLAVEIRNNHCRNERFIPILMPGSKTSDIPMILQNTLNYRWPEDFQDLCFHLTKPARVMKAAIKKFQKTLPSPPGTPGAASPMSLDPMSPSAGHQSPPRRNPTSQHANGISTNQGRLNGMIVNRFGSNSAATHSPTVTATVSSSVSQPPEPPGPPERSREEPARPMIVTYNWQG